MGSSIQRQLTFFQKAETSPKTYTFTNKFIYSVDNSNLDYKRDLFLRLDYRFA